MRESTIEIIKSTVPVLEKTATRITTRFYEMLLEENPELRSMFARSRQRSGQQAHALARVLIAFAKNIANPAVLDDALGGIARRHVGAQVEPRHYEIVGQCLLRSLSEVLGDAAAVGILDAWGEAYEFVARILIDKERQLYRERKAAQTQAQTQAQAPRDEPARVVSQLDLMSPEGALALCDSDKPLVLITAGTELVATIEMLHTAIAAGRRLVFLHACVGGSEHAFRRYVLRQARQNPWLRDAFVYEHAARDGTPHTIGLIDRSFVDADPAETRTDMEVYFVGPSSFMETVFDHIRRLGIPAGRFEFLGPQRPEADDDPTVDPATRSDGPPPMTHGWVEQTNPTPM